MEIYRAKSSIFILVLTFITFLGEQSCKKDNQDAPKPKADFSFVIRNQGALPDTVVFTSSATGATSLRWDLGNGSSSSSATIRAVYTKTGTYNVKLVASSQYGVDSVVRPLTISMSKPKADFIFVVRNSGFLPDTVDFTSTTVAATSMKWVFEDGKTDSSINPRKIFHLQGTFNVKLVATNAAGSDSITKPLILPLNKPVANFSFTLSGQEILPVVMTTNNTTIGSNVTYAWTFGNGNSAQNNPTNNFNAGGIYEVKLVATNASGSDSLTREVRIFPYPQLYHSISAGFLNLYAWEGQKVMILSRRNDLNRATMFRWLQTVDSAYGYYRACTGRDPLILASTYIDNHTTIADVPVTCGAGCSYVGFTGIEITNSSFDVNYQVINDYNQYDHLCFYEFGRNFWFYGSKLDYKEAGSFPIAGAYAVFMGSMEGRDAVGVEGSTVYGETYPQQKARFASFLNLYLADPTLNWSNTFAVDKGVPGHCNAADLFTSMCMKLKSDYGGDYFLRGIWKNAALQPDAVTTQDAVDNFFLAVCATANKNLTSLFQSWRFPLSTNAITAASKYP